MNKGNKPKHSLHVLTCHYFT